MSDYAVTNPATGEQTKTFPTITDDELDAAIALANETHRTWLRSTTVEERAKLVFLIEARPEQPDKFRVGQPVTVTLRQESP